VIRPCWGRGNVGGMQYQLFVRASDKGLRDIELLLAELDRARRILKLLCSRTSRAAVVPLLRATGPCCPE